MNGAGARQRPLRGLSADSVGSAAWRFASALTIEARVSALIEKEHRCPRQYRVDESDGCRRKQKTDRSPPLINATDVKSDGLMRELLS